MAVRLSHDEVKEGKTRDVPSSPLGEFGFSEIPWLISLKAGFSAKSTARPVESVIFMTRWPQRGLSVPFRRRITIRAMFMTLCYPAGHQKVLDLINKKKVESKHSIATTETRSHRGQISKKFPILSFPPRSQCPCGKNLCFGYRREKNRYSLNIKTKIGLNLQTSVNY